MLLAVPSCNTLEGLKCVLNLSNDVGYTTSALQQWLPTIDFYIHLSSRPFADQFTCKRSERDKIHMRWLSVEWQRLNTQLLLREGHGQWESVDRNNRPLCLCSQCAVKQTIVHNTSVENAPIENPWWNTQSDNSFFIITSRKSIFI